MEVCQLEMKEEDLSKLKIKNGTIDAWLTKAGILQLELHE